MFKNKIDERERQELYKIEHKIYWLVFVLLIVEIFVQQVIMKAPFAQVAGELVLLLAMCTVSLVLEFRGGHYDYFTQPGPKSYALYSTITGVICAVWIGTEVALTGYAEVLDVVIAVVATLVITFGFCYGALAIVGKATLKRRAKLEAALEEEEEEDEEE